MSLVLFRYSEIYLTTQRQGSSSNERNSSLVGYFPGQEVFNNSLTINTTLLSETCMSLVDKALMVWQRWPDNMAIKITNFNVKSFKDKLSAGCNVFKCSRTVFTSHTSLYCSAVPVSWQMFPSKIEKRVGDSQRTGFPVIQ